MTEAIDTERVTALQAGLAAQGVHTLLVQFTDLHGVAKGKLVPLAELDTMLRSGAGFAGPSIAGTGLPRTGPRSEYMARGDLATALGSNVYGYRIPSGKEPSPPLAVVLEAGVKEVQLGECHHLHARMLHAERSHMCRE